MQVFPRSQTDSRLPTEPVDLPLFARAVTYLDGSPGETHFTASQNRFFFLTRKQKESDFHEYSCPFGEVENLELTHSGMTECLKLVSGAKIIELRFAAWDHGLLERVRNLWLFSVQGHSPGRGEHPPFQKEPPLHLYCAGVHALMETGGLIHPQDRLALALSVGNRDAIHAGAGILQRLGAEALLEQCVSGLNYEQRICLLATLLDGASSDQEATEKEQNLVEMLRRAVGVDVPQAQYLRRVLVLKNPPDAFRHREEELAFAGVLIGIRLLRFDTGSPEATWFETLPGSPLQREAEAMAKQQSLDALMTQAGEWLNPSDKQALFAQSMALIMVNGCLSESGQHLLDELRSHLRLPIEDFQRIQAVLFTRHNLRIFG